MGQLFNVKPKFSKRIQFLKNNLTMLNMPLSQKALNLMIEEMSVQKGYFRSGSGEHYYHHVADVGVALINFGIRDDITIAAAFLHDAIEDVPWITYDFIKHEFNKEVADTVLLLTKKKDVDYKNNMDAWIEDLEAILSDVRATLIKVSDRVHNFSTLEGLPLAKQYRKAIETEKYFIEFFEIATEIYPEHTNFFLHAKTVIVPNLKNIKRKQRYNLV